MATWNTRALQATDDRKRRARWRWHERTNVLTHDNCVAVDPKRVSPLPQFLAQMGPKDAERRWFEHCTVEEHDGESKTTTEDRAGHHR